MLLNPFLLINFEPAKVDWHPIIGQVNLKLVKFTEQEMACGILSKNH